MTTSLLWFRNDLRLNDHPALLAAHEETAESSDAAVLGLYVLEPTIRTETAHYVWRCASLAALNDTMDGNLVIRSGDPNDVVLQAAQEIGATQVHATADPTPHGRRRDHDVADTLQAHGIELVLTGTPHAIGAGSVVKKDGDPYSVFTPFYKAWLDHGWPLPAPDLSKAITWYEDADSEPLPTHQGWDDLTHAPTAGERVALERLDEFCADGVLDYDDDRDRPAIDGTSRLSMHLAHGEIHPRTILAAISEHSGPSVSTYRKEIAWREFYADVLWHHPHTVRGYYKQAFAHMRHDTPAEQLRAWKFGQTGFPIVDAGMRQLRATGWMHNRVRMIVASFLVKDLHLEWQHGAAWFENNLYDLDIASNSHGWQWTAGCGTDASPYFRVFNPMTQGERFDPDGTYVREWIPELRHIHGKQVHQPWKTGVGGAHGYPEPIVDHAAERKESLARYEEIKGL